MKRCVSSKSSMTKLLRLFRLSTICFTVVSHSRRTPLIALTIKVGRGEREVGKLDDKSGLSKAVWLSSDFHAETKCQAHPQHTQLIKNHTVIIRVCLSTGGEPSPMETSKHSKSRQKNDVNNKRIVIPSTYTAILNLMTLTRWNVMIVGYRMQGM